LGYAQDDYVGCDVERGLGYCYNGKEVDGTGQSDHYGDQPPAVGVDFFQGPYLNSDGYDNPSYKGAGTAGYSFKGDCGIVDMDGQLIKLPLYNGASDSATVLINSAAMNGVNFGDGIVDNERFGMRRFVYHNRAGGGSNSAITDPELAIDYYQFLRGKWKDGTDMRYGGNAHGLTDALVCDFMFPADTDPCNWGTGGSKPAGFPTSDGDYWTEEQAGNKPFDRRFMQSAGPFTLEAGAVNYITVGIPWARATSGGAYASVELLRQVDDKCQRLFDNCFKVVDGPDAPDLVIQEMDQELILYLTNRKSSNNYQEKYEESDPSISETVIVDHDGNLDSLLAIKDVNLDSILADYTVELDRAYRFEGYQVYQLKDASVSIADLEDADKARLVAQCDIVNDVKKLVNFEYKEDLGGNDPIVKVDGKNQGIIHSFKIEEDQFATGDKELVNNKQYYFLAIAYAHNEYMEYSQDPNAQEAGVIGLDGQKEPYLAGRKNIITVTGIPHLISPENNGTILQTSFGSSVEVTRLEGNGNGGQQIELKDSIVDLIMSNTTTVWDLTYEKGLGPLNVKIVDPLNVVEGDFKLKLVNNSYQAEDVDLLTANWVLENINTGEKYYSDQTIDQSNEQLLFDLGISIHVENGGYELLYDEPESCLFPKQTAYEDVISMISFKPLESSINFEDSTNKWLTWIYDTDGPSPWNWIRSGSLEDKTDETNNDHNFTVFKGVECGSSSGNYVNYYFDPEENFESILDGAFAPYKMCSYQDLGPGLKNDYSFKKYDVNKLSDLSSVNLVITSDKSKWTRSPVIELGPERILAEGNVIKHSLRTGKSVDKDGNPDGTGTGMGWFPGYAINIETGERLNIVFGEDSWLSGENGRDMKWNPTENLITKADTVFGGKHYIYILGHNSDDSDRCPAYDEGKFFHDQLNTTYFNKLHLYQDVMWVGMPLLSHESGAELLANDVTIKIRVPKPYLRYSNKVGHAPVNAENNDYPMYSFSTKGLSVKKSDALTAKSALDLITVVPNPYYAYSTYETSQLDNRVKIVNIPAQGVVTIYTTEGKLIRQYKVDKSGIENRRTSGSGNPESIEALTSIDWDLKNHAGIPISGGLYIIHVNAPGIGEKIVKWFGTLRPVDLNSF